MPKNILNMNGSITIIAGPMFSGKTKKLIEHYHDLKKNNKKVLVFKSAIDERYSQAEVVSHDNEKIPALVVKEVREIRQFLDKDTEVILIDEVQLFFSEEVVSFLDNLAKDGKEIIATGLDWGCLNDIPISSVAGLLAVADKVIKVAGICDNCGDKAIKTQ
jgi:thymidine kinase